jgi:L-seryl-tRNA(Ser) seleniumtransferase
MIKANEFRRIPSVERVMALMPQNLLANPIARANSVQAVREVIDALRVRMKGGQAPSERECQPEAVAIASACRSLANMEGSLQPVINATGVILHTNLGRAPLDPKWFDEARERVAGYCNLEFDIASRHRGSRNDHAAGLLKRIVPAAEAALVVNNCAAGVLLVLTALAREREVIVSRGELVEIGGGFRVPDVMEASGARLVEVGTTNRTRLADYENAIGPDTGMLFKAHRSNFRMVGFVEDVGIPALVGLGRQRHLAVVLDLGSGLVSDPDVEASRGEPGPQEALAAGVDVVCISGDKLLGGPQAGIILGRAETLDRLGRHPLMRALRVDKLTLGVLEAVLRRHLTGSLDEIPALAALRLAPTAVKRRCHSLVQRVRRLGPPPGLDLRVVATEAEAGGGTLPARPIQSFGIEVRLLGATESEIDSRLRANNPPILGRIQAGVVVLDLRTLLPGQPDLLARALIRL